jgi:hypothetical protein
MSQPLKVAIATVQESESRGLSRAAATILHPFVELSLRTLGRSPFRFQKDPFQIGDVWVKNDLIVYIDYL